MAQIKLSIALVLAAAAIAPVVAQPIREGHEFADHIGHHHHHHHHNHRHPIPEQLSPETMSDTTSSPSSREYVDEFEVRGLLNGDLNILNLNPFENKEKALERTHQTLETENKSLQNKERYLEHKNHRLEREDGRLEHTKHSLERQDKSLLGKKHRLEREDNKLEHKLLGQRPVVHSEPEIDAREYTEFDDMFERGSEDIESGAKTLPRFKSPLHFGHGPVVPFKRPRLSIGHRPVFPFTRPRLPFRVGHGPALLPFTRPKLPFGHGPVVPFRRPRMQFGPGPVVLRHGPARTEVVAREYAEFDDMFERDLEDVEFDARDFDDGLYLD